MKHKSNQRITKIKIDKLEELLKKAESIPVENATIVQPLGADLVPYPNMDNLKKWTHDYLLSGLTKVFPVYRSEDGEQYFTTLIDGFPLFTKMTKSFKEVEIPGASIINSDLIVTTGTPTISDDFIYYTTTNSDYISFAESNIKVGTELVLKFTTNETTVNSNGQQYLCLLQDPFSIQFPSGSAKLAVWTTQWSYVTNEDLQPNTTYYIKIVINSVTSGALSCTTSISTDGVTYTNEVTHSNTQSLPGSNYIIGTSTDPSQYPANVKFDLNECYVLVDGVKNKFVTTGTSTEVVETSKPGLWLSNFITTISESSNGSWLRHNLIHSDEESYSSINADTIGNYSYSFIQRGEFFRTSDGGGWDSNCNRNDGQDIYNLQWLPGNNSSIAYRTLSNPGPRFGSVYSTYQTIITPDNPDMQEYQESHNKCLSFTHTNPYQEGTTSEYSAKVVGKDWTYEFQFRPNGKGSGNEYGSGSTPDAPNGSNGACITGTIKYNILNIGGTGDSLECTQEINSCYRTPQTLSNPNIDNNSNDLLITDNNVRSYNLYGELMGCCAGPVVINDHVIIPLSQLYYGKFSASTIDGCTATIASWIKDPRTYELHTGNCAIGGSNTQLISVTTSKVPISLNCDDTWCGDIYGTWSGTLVVADDINKPQPNINLYLNIRDLKAEAEAKGLIFDNTSCQTRFVYDLSTTKCTDSWCTSRLVAENVNINELGDISNLTEQTIKG